MYKLSKQIIKNQGLFSPLDTQDKRISTQEIKK